MDARRMIVDSVGISLVVLGVVHISMIGPTILNVPMIIAGIFFVYLAEVKRRQKLHLMK
jgi:hypothetical protein